MTLTAALARADALSGEGKYFQAHEELEESWMAASGQEKVLLQGLIQICAGLYRLRLDPAKPEGAFYLLDRGQEKLRSSAALLEARGLETLTGSLEKVRASGEAPEALVFGLRLR